MARFTVGVLYAAAVLTGLVVARQAVRQASGEADPGAPPMPPPQRFFAPSTASIH